MLGDAEREPSGVAHRAVALHDAAAATAEVAHHLGEAADGRVCAVVGAESVGLVLEAVLLDGRAAHYDERGDAARGDFDGAEVERRVDERERQRLEDRRVVGLAPGHHRGGREVLGADVDALLLDRADDLGRLPAQPFQHRVDERPVRRDDGQAVGPAALEAVLDVVVALQACNHPHSYL